MHDGPYLENGEGEGEGGDEVGEEQSEVGDGADGEGRELLELVPERVLEGELVVVVKRAQLGRQMRVERIEDALLRTAVDLHHHHHHQERSSALAIG